MNLRSLKLVNFRGVRELTVRDLPREGVVRLDIPGDAEPGALSDAVRFALTGRAPDSGPAMSRGEGFAYVEAGLRLPGDARASVFRGIDRRGNGQASLREAGGQRVTGGAEGVAARLAELTGGDPQSFARAAIVSSNGVASPGAPADPTQPQRAAPVRTAEVSAAPADATLRAEQAVADFSRALRAERLHALATAAHDELVKLGARLRRERLGVAQDIDRLHADRDRLRTRLRRVNEYRDQAQRDDSAATSPRAGVTPQRDDPPREGRALEWSLAFIACALLALLAFVSTSANTALEDHRLRAFVGMAFVASAASYVGVASARQREVTRRAPARVRTTTEQGAVESTTEVEDRAAQRDSLRRRFADLGDPDDPALPRRLRDELAGLDERLAPLHDRLETLDNGVAVADVETGRSSRALHLALPGKDVAPDGLSADESVEDVVARARELGDIVFRSSVERDALLADDVPAAAAARAHLLDALAAVAAATGQENQLAEARSRVEAAEPGDTTHPAEDEVAAELRNDIARLSATEREPAGSLDAARGADRHAPAVAFPRQSTPAQDFARVVADVTHGAYIGAAPDDAGALVLTRADGSREALSDAAPGVRARVQLAWRIRAGSNGGPRPGFVVLEGIDAALSDEDLIDVVRATAPEVTQILLPVG